MVGERWRARWTNGDLVLYRFFGEDWAACGDFCGQLSRYRYGDIWSQRYSGDASDIELLSDPEGYPWHGVTSWA